MTMQALDLQAMARFALAVAILNRTRSLLSARIDDVEADDRFEAERLRGLRSRLLEIQHSLRPEETTKVKMQIAMWSPCIRGGEQF